MADFYEGMVDYLQLALKVSVAEVNRLRGVNDELMHALDGVAPEMWAMREEITTLRLQLDAAVANSHRDDGGNAR
jgi:hypothetical protein